MAARLDPVEQHLLDPLQRLDHQGRASVPSRIASCLNSSVRVPAVFGMPFSLLELNHPAKGCVCLDQAHVFAHGKHMTKDQQRLKRQLDRFDRLLPAWSSRMLRWLREPSSRWGRIPMGLLLVFGGILGFLPLLGLWMLPFGLLLLSQDLPFLCRPIRRMLICLERRWARWKRRRKS